MRVLVTGASGYIGQALVDRLARSANFSVRAATRSARVDGNSNIQWTTCMPLGPASDWSNALQGVDVVVHAAAVVHKPRPDAADVIAMYQVNSEGTLRLARQAADAGVQRFIFLSTIAVHGVEASDTILTEDSPLTPVTDYGRSKLLAEQGLEALSQRMEVVIVRPPIVYGPRAPGNFSRLLKLVDSGVPLPLAHCHNRRSMIGVENLVDFLVRCLSAPGLGGKVLLVSDDEDVTVRELIELMATGLGRRPRLFGIPEPVLTGLATALGARTAYKKLFGSLRLDIARSRRLLEWTPPANPREAIPQAAKLSAA